MGSLIDPKGRSFIDRKDAGAEPIMVVEGMEDVIKLDLEKHKEILARTKLELQAYKNARAHEIKRKKHYKSLIGGGKYNDEALKKSIQDINVNITHMSNKVKLAEDKIQHNTLIVDTLSKQLEDQYKGLATLAEHRKRTIDALSDRLV